MKNIFKANFNPVDLTVVFLNGGVFLQKVLETLPGGQSYPLSGMIAPPTTIQTLIFFHEQCYFDFRVFNKTLHVTGVIKSRSRIVPLVQKVIDV